MDNPLVTIVTPSFNQGEFIEDTIISVKNQDYGNVEHIVIDGNSTDGTVEILEEYEDSYNLKWISEDDDGQSDAVNKGFRKSQGEIVGWLNSDDVYYSTDTISSMVKQFSQQPETDICYGNIVYIDGNSRIYRCQASPGFNSDRLRTYNHIPQPGVFFHSNLVNEEFLDTDLVFAMDYEYWLRLDQKGYNFSHINKIVAGFRTHESAKGPRLGVEILEKEVDHLQSKYPENTTYMGYLYEFHSKILQLIANVKLPFIKGEKPPALT